MAQHCRYSGYFSWTLNKLICRIDCRKRGGGETTVSLINVAVWSTIYIHIHIFLKSVLLLGNKSVSVCIDTCVSLFLHCFVKQFLVGYLPAVNMTPISYLGGGVSSPMLRLLSILTPQILDIWIRTELIVSLIIVWTYLVKMKQSLMSRNVKCGCERLLEGL